MSGLLLDLPGGGFVVEVKGQFVYRREMGGDVVVDLDGPYTSEELRLIADRMETA